VSLILLILHLRLTILRKILLHGLKKRMVRPPKMKGDSPFWCLVTTVEWICCYLMDGSYHTILLSISGLIIYVMTYELVMNHVWCDEWCAKWELLFMDLFVVLYYDSVM
jgi:hypothetical protein